jgi:predicted XRE-type DNA-binding protein
MEVHASSGNIFADMGLPNAEERLAKAEVALRIEELIADRKLPQAQAAELMGLSQADMADMVRGRLKGHTLERLFQCLTALDQDVEIVIRPKQDAARQARILVTHL